MIAIVCDTPYQLMSAIMVACSFNNTDEPFVFFINTYLYHMEQSFDYSAGYPRIGSICYYGRKQMSAGLLLSGLINPLRMLDSIEGFDRNINLSCIISSRTTYIATYLYNYFQKKNPGLKLCLVEEGIGEYSSRLIHTRFTRVCAFLHKKTHLDRVSEAYFSAPDLYPYETGFPVKKVPPLTKEGREIIESMFNMQNIKDNNLLNSYSCVILSEPTTVELKKQEDVDKYNRVEEDILDALADVMGAENTVIKVHPIDPNFKNDKIKTYYTKLPMESLLLSMDADSKIFVSPMSTAMLTPRLLFGKVPFLVFTYKMLMGPILAHVGDEAHLGRYIAFVNNFIAAYPDPSKCAAPGSIGELKEVLFAFSARAKELQTKD
jgi:hypothetical protein